MEQRRAGILLHPTSLPGQGKNGTLGDEAYRFVDFLVRAGVTVWQMLPINPTHGDGSPYHALSVHAGSPLLIDLPWLVRRGWLDEAPQPTADHSEENQHRYLAQAHANFMARADSDAAGRYQAFIARHAHWLDDYSLFQALRQLNGHRHWLAWPEALRDCDSGALADHRQRLAADIDRVRFEQYLFFSQWHELRDYANRQGVLLLGDVPIFVAHDSAEVWRHREYFSLDEHGQALTVAGVPPDYFSETGQLWGNPLYRWDRLEADDFQWWKARLATQLSLFDALRIDHFRGFEAYWEIPAHAETAMEGHWVKAPGEALFKALQARFESLPVIAEDLGVITEEVNQLRRQFGLPGMKILQFAFDGDDSNPYLPHNHEALSVVYTGTHDNTTTLGWYRELSPEVRRRVDDYLGHPQAPMPWPLIQCALESAASLAVIPMQDVLGLDGDHRMNTPGTTCEGNWRWRFQWCQVDAEAAARFRMLAERSGRLSAPNPDL